MVVRDGQGEQNGDRKADQNESELKGAGNVSVGQLRVRRIRGLLLWLVLAIVSVVVERVVGRADDLGQDVHGGDVEEDAASQDKEYADAVSCVASLAHGPQDAVGQSGREGGHKGYALAK